MLSYIYVFKVCFKICWETGWIYTAKTSFGIHLLIYFSMYPLRPPTEKWVYFPKYILAITKRGVFGGGYIFNLVEKSLQWWGDCLFFLVRILLGKKSFQKRVMGFSDDWPDPEAKTSKEKPDGFTTTDFQQDKVFVFIDCFSVLVWHSLLY